MRLIDADVALQRFIKETETSGKNAIHINTIKRLLQDMDTAYDVEKVVEELKGWSFKTEIVIPTSDGFEDTANREIICTLNAIDIVRKGGVE